MQSGAESFSKRCREMYGYAEDDMPTTSVFDRDIARTHSGLRGTFILMGCVSVVLVGVSFALLFRSRPR